jgi:F0F1-type ATP synthase epsilon subunit
LIEEKTAASEATAAAREQQASSKAGKPTMAIKVYSPFKVYYEEESYSISGTNATGPFDILPHHHHFMTLLNPGELTIHPVNGRPEQRIRISGGLMHVKADRVTVFLDI